MPPDPLRARLVPRSKMPQVDAADLPKLVAAAVMKSLATSFEVVEAKQLRSRQRVNRRMAVQMPDFVLYKPVLVSKDDYVLDGNHRWYASKVRRKPITIIRLGLTFDEALPWLFEQPYTYAITKSTPIRN